MIKKTLTTLLAITAIFGLAQFAAAQTAESNSPPAESIEKLIELTLPAHPWVNIPLPSAPSKPVDEAGRQKQVKLLDDALAVNQDLTPEQKAFVKANYDELREIVGKQVSDVIGSIFPMKQWAEENLEQRFTEKLTAAEVNKLIAYFEGNAGRKTLKVFKTAGPSQEIEKNGGAPLFTRAEEAEADRFAATAVGKKFMDAFLGEAKEYLDAKMEASGRSSESKIKAIVAPANLNKILNKFVADNYKK